MSEEFCVCVIFFEANKQTTDKMTTMMTSNDLNGPQKGLNVSQLDYKTEKLMDLWNNCFVHIQILIFSRSKNENLQKFQNWLKTVFPDKQL